MADTSQCSDFSTKVTHRGLMMSYGDIELGQHWLGQHWLLVFVQENCERVYPQVVFQVGLVCLMTPNKPIQDAVVDCSRVPICGFGALGFSSWLQPRTEEQSYTGACPTKDISTAFNENCHCYSLKKTGLITTKFGTYQDSTAALVCA